MRKEALRPISPATASPSQSSIGSLSSWAAKYLTVTGEFLRSFNLMKTMSSKIKATKKPRYSVTVKSSLEASVVVVAFGAVYAVGESAGWTTIGNVDYKQWAATKTFKPGDTIVLNGKIMHKVGVEDVGVGALKLTAYLREQMQQKNIHFDSLYTVRSLKETNRFISGITRQLKVRHRVNCSFPSARENGTD